MKLSEAPIGVRVVVSENMDTEDSHEVRHTYYKRREGVANYNSNPTKPTAFVTAYQLRLTQGEPGKKYRYDTGEHRTPCEVDGRINVEIVQGFGIGDTALDRFIAKYASSPEAAEALLIEIGVVRDNEPDAPPTNRKEFIADWLFKNFGICHNPPEWWLERATDLLERLDEFDHG